MRLDAGEIYDYVFALEKERDELESERDEFAEKIETLEKDIANHECPTCEREHSEPKATPPHA